MTTIRTNVTSLIAQRFLTNNNEALNSSVEKLSSGYRINKSKDDSAGLAISESMRSKIRSLDQAKRNANDATSMLQVAEGGMNEMSNILVRMRELTVQAATDTLGEKERSYLNKEYTQLASEIDRIAATTEFNGNKFFVPNGDMSSFTIQVGADSTKVEENRDTLSINLEGLRFSTADLGIGKGAEIGALGTETGPSRDAIAEKLTTLDAALGRVANERANVGALQSRLSSTVNNLMVSVESLNAAKGRIVDVDYANETSNLAKQRILSQANMSVLAQANQAPDMALALIRG